MYVLLCVMMLIYCYCSYVASGVIPAYNFRNYRCVLHFYWFRCDCAFVILFDAVIDNFYLLPCMGTELYLPDGDVH